MFPETFVRKHLALLGSGSVVFDPFSGRGTTAFESIMSGYPAIAVDTNPVAVCVSRAKCRAPDKKLLLDRIIQLKGAFEPVESELYDDSFFKLCFSTHTLRQILYLRSVLRWREDDVDCFIAAMCVGCLHGESHRSARVFSNRMPRTISTKPAYSVRWWTERSLVPPIRDVFDILVEEAHFRYHSAPPVIRADIAEGDARAASRLLRQHNSSVQLMVTSPPYLDVTHFREDQWLRVWFLGGEPFPCRSSEGDDRHTDKAAYWKFLHDVWEGSSALFRDDAKLVLRIGGKKIALEEAREELTSTLSAVFGPIECVDAVTTTIQNGQLRSFRPKAAGTNREFDIIFRLGANSSSRLRKTETTPISGSVGEEQKRSAVHAISN